jgi:hypothetical protein
MIPTLDNLYNANPLFKGRLFESCAERNGFVRGAKLHRI